MRFVLQSHSPLYQVVSKGSADSVDVLLSHGATTECLVSLIIHLNRRKIPNSCSVLQPDMLVDVEESIEQNDSGVTQLVVCASSAEDIRKVRAMGHVVFNWPVLNITISFSGH